MRMFEAMLYRMDVSHVSSYYGRRRHETRLRMSPPFLRRKKGDTAYLGEKVPSAFSVMVFPTDLSIKRYALPRSHPQSSLIAFTKLAFAVLGLHSSATRLGGIIGVFLEPPLISLTHSSTLMVGSTSWLPLSGFKRMPN